MTDCDSSTFITFGRIHDMLVMPACQYLLGSPSKAKIAVMIRSGLTIAALASACGTVGSEPKDGAVGDGQSNETPVMYKATMAQTPAMPFGGAPYCSYTITLKQLDVELGILPSSKQVTTGRIQDLNVEAVVPTTPPCMYTATPPTIANYTLASAMPSASGTTLTFQGDPTNAPVVSLGVELTSAGSVYQARLGFQRTDEPPPLNWSVLVTVTLSPQ